MARHKKKRKDRNAPETVVDPGAVLRIFKERRTPLNPSQILRALNLKKRAKEELHQVLRGLVDSGRIIRTRSAYGLPERMRMITGRLEVQRSGVGFLIPEDQRRKDVFISPKDMGDAWHGDRVVAVIVRENKNRNHEGRIVRILERNRQNLPARVGRTMGRGLYMLRPTDPRLGFGIVAERVSKNLPVNVGDVVLVTPGEQLDPQLWEGVIQENFGPEDSVAVQESIVKINNDIPTVFPEAVLKEAETLPEQPGEADFAGREDFRDVPFVTIDGASARDFDDAVFVERAKGGYRLWVAIADVSHYVRPGSALDEEALERGNSYYFPQSVEPMFPERLSNGLCSLNPDVPRLTMVARMEVDGRGEVRSSEFFVAVIKSHARLTYGQVQRAVLLKEPEERRKVEHVLPMLELAEELARKINARRSERGSLDFDLPEPEILFDRGGETIDIRPKERHFGHQLIEEFMIAANESVAEFLTERGLPCMYRIHPPADEEKLRNLFKMLSRTAIDEASKMSMPDEITPRTLQDLLALVEGTDREFVVNRMLLRTMKQAKYSAINEGHFGLASECYCHFTSPIRRYADLVVHRILKAAIGQGGSMPGVKRVSHVAGLISSKERNAMQAEREILKRVTLLFLSNRVGETFTGVISSLAEFGFWIELKEVMGDGLIRLSTLTDDYYAYWRDHEMIVGERTGRSFRMGQTVRAKLEEVNMDRLEMLFSLVEGGESYKKFVK